MNLKGFLGAAASVVVLAGAAAALYTWLRKKDGSCSRFDYEEDCCPGCDCDAKTADCGPDNCCFAEKQDCCENEECCCEEEQKPEAE